ncbi:MAG: prolyl oligopeptidase family serine peptidase, partial [Chloroflexaceae bacterium]|nr:prolyl oligopeptidase family serine peptidase [Chloroflexaceae bacterium]
MVRYDGVTWCSLPAHPFPPQNAPMVIWQEGGPGLFMTSTWATNVESPYVLLPNFGISVLVVPLPGREGWGPEFYNGLAQPGAFGSIDIDEMAQIVRQMHALGWTSPDRTGVTGCSYGGYFTSQSIVRHPDLYAAANTQCSLLDTLVEWQTGFTWFMSYLIGTSPPLSVDTFLGNSPLYGAENVRTPTLIFHGDFDFLPVSIAETFHERIAATGTTVRMLKFQGEGHSLGLPENQITAAQEQITWFRRYLATGRSPGRTRAGSTACRTGPGG